MNEERGMSGLARVIARAVWEASSQGTVYGRFEYGDMVFGWWPEGLCQGMNGADGTEIWVPTGGGRPWSQRPEQRINHGWWVRKEKAARELLRYVEAQLKRQDVRQMHERIVAGDEDFEPSEPDTEVDPFE